MNDSAIFQGLARAWSTGTPPVATPVAIWKAIYFDCPVAAAAEVQKFVGRQIQEQVQLFAELSREQNAATAFTREAAFLQQSAMAWSQEVLAIAELVQGKLLTAAQGITEEQKTTPYAAAA